MKEFRLAVATKLPEDEFEQAAAVMACGKFKAEVIKLMEAHKIVGTVGHEIVTPRGPNVAKTIPAAPPSQNLQQDPTPTDPAATDVHPDKPHGSGRTPPLRAA